MDKQKEKLIKMVAAERAKCQGYEELVKLHRAYITILLQRLNATEKNALKITQEEIKQAMDELEVRAYPDNNSGMNLYYVEADRLVVKEI